jgi:serine phosphatase RsbU (regulator of sigma subunit)
MRLGTKLILAFFLLSVLPLAGITLYFYQSSISVIRKAVEAESASITEQMNGRMAELRREIDARIQRLATFNFNELMALKDSKVDSNSNPSMAKLMSEIGDLLPYLDSIQFNRRNPPRGSSSPRPMPPSRAASVPLDRPEPQQLLIQLSDDSQPAVGSSKSGASSTPPGDTMIIRPSMRGPANARPLTEAEKQQKLVDEFKQIKEFQVALEKMEPPKLEPGFAGGRNNSAGAEARSGAGENRSRADSGKRAPGPTVDLPRKSLTDNLGTEVHTDGNSIGTVNARFSPQRLFRNVLGEGRRRPGEIAFFIDSDKTLYTLSVEDENKLKALGIPEWVQAPDSKGASSELKDWVVVTKKDDSSNVTFGIARPIDETLREIRTTAARNLGYGLGMIIVAMIGIIPLSNRMTRHLAALTQGAEQLARGDLNTRVSVRTKDEIGRLAESFNRMAHDLNENQKRLIEQERMREELEMSRRIQTELLPKQAYSSGRVEVKGISIPAMEVGGDFFNYFPLPKGEVAILVGDVSGKGVAAALLMANLQATLQARLPLEPDLSVLASQLDYEIHGNTPPEVYLTLFMSILDPVQGILRYVNAGHNTQFALHSQGTIEKLESTGRPLGLMPGGSFEQKSIDLKGGDGLFLYTDGLVEAENAQGEPFGGERLESVLFEERTHGINEILIRVEEENSRHRGSVEAADDATMLALKLR